MNGIVKLLMIGLVLSLCVCMVSGALAGQGEAGETEGTQNAEQTEGPDEKLDDIVVTATRTETSIEHIADSVTVITGEDIELKGQYDLYDILNDVPGVSMKRCGGPGQWTSVKMRGGP